MRLKSIIKKSGKLSRPFRVSKGEAFRLKDVDPGDTLGFGPDEKVRAQQVLAMGIEALAKLQDMLYAQDRWAVLVIFQAMDAAGKDGTIKHVMSGVNPQGCEVSSFKAPSDEELDHDYLWRCVKRLPERGRIGIFNRSYYEEVLVLRVHPELLERERLPIEAEPKEIFEDRYTDIRRFERYLSRNGVVVLKFFLHVSKKEQKKRLLERLNDPRKYWKFSGDDVKERAYWKEYMDAFETMVRRTATKHAPWYVVPADNKWFTRAVVAAAIVDALGSLDLHYPELSPERLKELAKARRALLGKA
ncbi:MAG TPA: polyphosphate kinase 2 family protein [Methylomirabilota bacterium]|jgi:PPK2 family polyphosphate:nucleotide phosphotransferase|nr:polyphosphate kinase 2 family protein [Methylomirabilota bacterium]